MTTPHPALDHGDLLPAGSPRPSVRPRAGIWPWVPALLLGSLLGTQLGVLSSTLEDPSVSTEPDYYRKALDWDARQARLRQSQALGWAARASDGGASPGGREVQVSIVDAHGAPVSGATVRALAFPNARAGQPLELSLRESSPGVYSADLGVARPGIWELRCSATRGQQQFESTLRFELEDRIGKP